MIGFPDLILYLLFGMIGGILSGLAGVGGGIVFVPTLVFVAGWGIREAVAASLVIIAFSALSGTIRNQRSSDPPVWKWVLLLSLSVAPSTLIGVAISRVSPETVVEVCFAVLLLVLAYPTARGSRNLGADTRGLPAWAVLGAGVFIGTLSGLVGVGGGVAMVPLMILGIGIGAKRAVSTSLAVVMFAGLIGGIGYILTGFDRIAELPLLVAGGMLGAWLGVKLRDPLPESVIRSGFAVFMVLVAIRTLLGAF